MDDFDIHSLSREEIQERYEAILGPAKFPQPVRDFRREQVEREIGHHVVEFIGLDKPWSNYGRIAVQNFRLDTPCVYFVGGDLGAIKIGTSIAPLERLATFQMGSPIKLQILALTLGGRKEERAYHTRFAAHWQRGEWFERHPDILAEIDRLNSLPLPAGVGRVG